MCVCVCVTGVCGPPTGAVPGELDQVSVGL